jgi:hypothetical protein
VIGRDSELQDSIAIFKIDLEKQAYHHKGYWVHGYPQGISVLPDRKIRFTRCYDSVIDNNICTLDADTGKETWMERPGPDNPDYWLPDLITGHNLFVLKFPSGDLRLLRKGKDLGSVPYGNHELLVADIPNGFVSGFGNQLLSRDDDGNVIEELLKDQTVHEVRYQDGLLTAVSSVDGETQISAWQVADAVHDEVTV